MSHRLNQVIENKKTNNEKLLSIFITAGFPEKNDTVEIILNLADSGVDFIELGIPFSDPIADGPIIQKASDQALKNGVNLEGILKTVSEVRKLSDIPIILMGYLNPVHKMGFDKFLSKAQDVGVNGLILPDWPYDESKSYIQKLNRIGLDVIYLIAPNTPKDRIKQINDVSTSFIYCVAYTGVTGQENNPTQETIEFFNFLNQNLTRPWIIGFGVKNYQDFQTYTKYADGVIIGSAFIKLLVETPGNIRSKSIKKFIDKIKN